jgi:hypothetical protein
VSGRPHGPRKALSILSCLRAASPVRGSILILVIIIFTSLATFGGILLGFVYTRFIAYQLEMDRTKALYIAEAGISYAVWELKMNKDLEGNGYGNVSRFEFGDGYFSTVHNPETRQIMSTGTCNDVSRMVAIVYESN